ncbi:hypothetical protein BsWGS_04478 [Bradybaena similaris]
MQAAMRIWRVFIVALLGIAQLDAAEWSYAGNKGPAFWHEVFPKACSGTSQSPIDIRSEETVYDPRLKEFAIYYDPPKPDSKMFIRNNGHTVQVSLEGDFFVTNGGLNHVYKALQFHFHWGHKENHGSEHLIDGQASPIEMHLVTYNHELFTDVGEAVVTEGGLAVLGVMYEISEEDNPSLDTIVKAIKHVRDPETHDKIALPLMSIRDFLPKDLSRYYRYNGSLTTPGCFESVIWTVMLEKQTISLAQLKQFKTLLQHKHYHKKSHDSNGKRHRRSLNKAERKMERKAEQVLDELGIRGDGFKEAVLMSDVMEMMSDMPQDGEDMKQISAENEEHDKEEKTKDDPETENTSKEKHEEDKNEDDHKEKHEDEKNEDNHGEKNLKEGEDHGTDEDEHTKDQEEHADDHASEEKKIVEEVHEEDFTQDIMVNNFRPVQPLNNRVVYRSFKSLNVVLETDSDTDDEVIVFSSAHSSDNNRALNHVMSLPAILTLSILTLISFLNIL